MRSCQSLTSSAYLVTTGSWMTPKVGAARMYSDRVDVWPAHVHSLYLYAVDQTLLLLEEGSEVGFFASSPRSPRSHVSSSYCCGAGGDPGQGPPRQPSGSLAATTLSRGDATTPLSSRECSVPWASSQHWGSASVFGGDSRLRGGGEGNPADQKQRRARVLQRSARFPMGIPCLLHMGRSPTRHLRSPQAVADDAAAALLSAVGGPLSPLHPHPPALTPELFDDLIVRRIF